MGLWSSRESRRTFDGKRLHPRTATTWRPLTFSHTASGGLAFGGGAGLVGATLRSYTGNGVLTFGGSAVRSKVFTFQPIGVDTVILAWDAAANALGYRVYWGTTSGVYTHSVSVGAVLQYALDGSNFSAGTTYFFVVSSIYAVGAVASAPTNVRLAGP